MCQASASSMRPAFTSTLKRAFLPAIARFRGLPLPSLRALSVGPPDSGLVREGARGEAGEREDKGGKGWEVGEIANRGWAGRQGNTGWGGG
ncbi:MAG: hypothetical protein ACK55Z_12130, partial [bacterium]